MAKYQLIIDGEVVNTIEADQSYLDAIVSQYDSIVELIPPPEPEPAPPPELVPPAPEPIRVSPIEFKLLFTSAERVAIKDARTTDPIIDDFFDIIDDPRLTEVNLSLNSTISAINYLAAQGLIQPERVDQILAGTFQ